MKMALLILSLAGVAISAYALSHFLGVSSGTLCNWSDSLNCDLVNKSIYAEFGGIPVSLIGIIGYGFLAVGSILKLLERKTDHGLTRVLLVASYGAMAFSLYLTGIEAFVLRAYCPTCLASLGLILSLSILTTLLYRMERVGGGEAM